MEIQKVQQRVCVSGVEKLKFLGYKIEKLVHTDVMVRFIGRRIEMVYYPLLC